MRKRHIRTVALTCAVLLLTVGLAGTASAQPEPQGSGGDAAGHLVADSRYYISYEQPATLFERAGSFPPLAWLRGPQMPPPAGLSGLDLPAALINMPATLIRFTIYAAVTVIAAIWYVIAWGVVIATRAPDVVMYVVADVQNTAIATIAGVQPGSGGLQQGSGLFASGALWLAAVVMLSLLTRQALRGDIDRVVRGGLVYFTITGVLLSLLIGAALDTQSPQGQVLKASPAGIVIMSNQVVGSVAGALAGGLGNLPRPTRDGQIATHQAIGVVAPEDFLVDVAPDGTYLSAGDPRVDNVLEMPFFYDTMLHAAGVVDAAGSGGQGQFDERSVGNAPAAFIAGYHYRMSVARFSGSIYGWGDEPPAGFGTALSAQQWSRHDKELTRSVVDRFAPGAGQPHACLFSYPNAFSREDCRDNKDLDPGARSKRRATAQRNMDLAWSACRVQRNGQVSAKPVWAEVFDDLNEECGEWWRAGTIPKSFDERDPDDIIERALDSGAPERQAEQIAATVDAVHGGGSYFPTSTMGGLMRMLITLPGVIALGLLVLGISLLLAFRAARFSALLLMLPFGLLATSIPRFSTHSSALNLIQLGQTTKRYWTMLRDDFLSFATYSLTFSALAALAIWVTSLAGLMLFGVSSP